MRISHPCLSCGGDLRRQRIRRDGPGGLPIVTCPRCGRAATRRTDRSSARRRAGVRLAKTLLALVLQLGALASFVAIITAVCDPYAHDLLRGRAREATQYIVTGLIAVALGAWLTAALAHWPRWAAWLAFTGLVASLLAAAFVLIPVVGVILRELGVPVGGRPVRLDRWVAAVVVLTAIMVVALGGIPVGVAARAAVEHARRWAWRAQRRRGRDRSLR